MTAHRKAVERVEIERFNMTSKVDLQDVEYPDKIKVYTHARGRFVSPTAFRHKKENAPCPHS